MGRPSIDLTGQKFGLLTAVRQVMGSNKKSRWACICACSRIVLVFSHNLRKGQARHNGPCPVREAAARARSTKPSEARRRARLKKAGICMRCSKPSAPGRTRCDTHLLLARADTARRAARQKEKQNNS